MNMIQDKDNIKRVVIWGAANAGQTAFDLLSGIDSVSVVAFGDNNKELQGNSYNDLPIIGMDSICSISFDYIVIASINYEDEIYRQISLFCDKPVFKNVAEILYKRFSIDISGWCNAKCKWCSTGRKNLYNGIKQQYMPIGEFAKLYNHLKAINLLHPFNELLLYSWGEPFINPDYKEIIDFLHKNHQVFSLSTNASVSQYIYGKKLSYEYCNTIVFSMPGFSQASYDRIHKLNFETIKRNISLLIDNMCEHGFKGRALISYHVYQFNENELNDAKEFADSLGIELEPVRAYFASYDMTQAYLKNNMMQEDKVEAENELYLTHVKELIEQRPAGYLCLVENMVSIHCDGRLELCCCCDDSAEDFLWDSAYKISSLREWQQYREKMMSCDTCKKCRELGIDYWLFNSPNYEEGRV